MFFRVFPFLDLPVSLSDEERYTGLAQSLVLMQRTSPDLLISYQLPLPEAAFRPFIDAVKVPRLSLVVEPRPPAGAFAGFPWLLPTAVFIYFGRSYFDGFLKEAGKDHYSAIKRGLSLLWPQFFGKDRRIRLTAIGSRGKLRPDDAKYSLGISILAEAGSGFHFKLLFPDDLSADGLNTATAMFLGFLERYYAGELDASTEARLAAARAVGRTILVTYDLEQDVFIFLDPIQGRPGQG